MKAVGWTAILLSGASVFVIATVASAQTVSSSADEVVVTGSRVIKNGNNSPTPVTVVPVDEALELRPSTVADALNELPVFAGSRGQFSDTYSAAGPTQPMGGGNPSGNFLNLRNMGSQRTLILFDNHRMAPTNASGYIDTDMIPQMLLQRVDVVTGGASAVYGSDAITGVVNFVTDRNFNGVKAQAQYGITQHGDDINYDFGIAAGQSVLGGRGHVEASYEYRNDLGVLYQSSRDPNHLTYQLEGAGTAASPYYMTPGGRNTSSTFGGLINLGVLSGMTFNQNGVLSPFVHGTPTGTANMEIGGNGYYSDTSLKAPQRSNQFFGRFDYDFTDNLHGYMEVTANDKKNESFGPWFSTSNVTVSSTDAYLPATYQAQLTAAKQSTFRMSKQDMSVPRTENTVDESETYFNGGLEGDLGHGYKWDAGYVHSAATLTLTDLTNVNNQNLAAALDAVVNPANGQIVCNVTLTNPSLYPGCVPLNPFGPTSANPAAVAFIRNTTQFVEHTTMDDVAGSASGSPISLPAGPVNVALSGEWRKVVYSGTSNAIPTAFANCTGLRFNCTATTPVYNGTIGSRSPVQLQVSEGALETDAPLLKDTFLVQSLNLNGAVRYTSYSTSGSYITWKVGVDWHVNDEVRFRGTRSHDIRAPSLDDLYQPTTSSVGGYPDLLTNSGPTQVTAIVEGNPNLKAEAGDTWSGGVVWRPKFVPGFSLSLDYFDITVSNAITPLLAINATYQRACYASGGSSPFCELQVRPLGFTNTTAANAPTTVYSTTINVTDVHTDGMDIEANYATRVLNRPASFRLLTTYQPTIAQTAQNLVTLDQAGVAFGTNSIQASAVWRLTGFVRYSPFENFNIDLETRWRSDLKFSPDPTVVVSTPNIPSVSFTDMNFAYTIKSHLGQSELFLNVSNIFNTAPPPVAYYGSQSGPGTQTEFAIGDDPLGRAFTVGIRFRH